MREPSTGGNCRPWLDQVIHRPAHPPPRALSSTRPVARKRKVAARRAHCWNVRDAGSPQASAMVGSSIMHEYHACYDAMVHDAKRTVSLTM
eukprot:6109518-Prymnesium_polylepis.1